MARKEHVLHWKQDQNDTVVIPAYESNAEQLRGACVTEEMLSLSGQLP